MNPHSNQTLRVLLRDTALQLALLSQQAEIPSVPLWRARCAGLAEQLRAAMRDADYDAALIAEASYAQCALLDDAALRHLSDDQRREWQRASLEMHFFSSQQAADVIYQRIEHLLRQAEPSAERLALYDLMLGLGFCGRYPSQDHPDRQQLIAGLVRFAPITERIPPLPDHADARRPPVGAVALCVWSALCIGFSLLLWLALERQLGHDMQRLFQLQTMPAVRTQEN